MNLPRRMGAFCLFIATISQVVSCGHSAPRVESGLTSPLIRLGNGGRFYKGGALLCLSIPFHQMKLKPSNCSA